MKRYLLSLAAALCVSASMWGVVATPELIVKTQADGSTVTLKLVGDEFHSYYTRTDGTPVRLNKKGMWEDDLSLATPSAEARKARRIAKQTNISSSFPLTGSPKSVVILVNFTDLKFTHTLAEFQDMLNTSGYNKNGGVGSARDYFIGCSDSIFSPIFDCYGPVTLSNDYAYYGANSGSSNSVHAAQMVVEACNLVAESGVDFTQYDTNDDGRIDNVFIYFAGHNEAEGADANTIWPHRSIVTGSNRVNGKLIYDYACTSEMRGRSGNSMCGIGTFCHEFGHVLGLPDYYDTDYKFYTVGSWDIMCNGSYNGNGKTPPTYTSGERFQLGWLTPVQLKNAGLYTLEPLETSNQAYLIAATDHNLSWDNATPNEYWLLENRQNLGWDAPSSSLPGTGMLIWHITYNASAWGANEPNNSLPLRYRLEEAGGSKGYAAASDPYPGTFNITQFTPVLNNGPLVEQPLTGIALSGKNITFTFKSNGFMFLPTELPVLQSTYNPETKKAETPAQAMKIVGEHLDPESTVTISVTGSGFTFSTDSSSWVTSYEAPVNADSTMELPIYVRYAPRKQVCDIQRGTSSARQGQSAGSFTIRGTSPRPVLIEAPSITEVNDITPTSFKVKWAPQSDAEYYYVTMFHLEEGTESQMESFEGFDDEATVHEAGWYSSFYRTTTKAKADGSVSMWFKESNEQMLSPIYPLAVSGVSLWLNAPATSDTEVGQLILTGISDSKDYIIDTIEIHKNTKQYTYSRSLDESLGIRRFSIEYKSFGGEGVCMDAFTTTFNQKTVYTYKGRERTIVAQEGDIAEDYTVLYAYDLMPNTEYCIQLQCSEEKGCEEHLSDLGMPFWITTKEGENADSKRLTLAYDSISYDPATHIVYLPQSLKSGSVCIYSAEGELVKRIPVSPTVNIVPLPDAELRRGAIYIVKYLPEDTMSRKGPWIKILFK